MNCFVFGGEFKFEVFLDECVECVVVVVICCVKCYFVVCEYGERFRGEFEFG